MWDCNNCTYLATQTDNKSGFWVNIYWLSPGWYPAILERCAAGRGCLAFTASSRYCCGARFEQFFFHTIFCTLRGLHSADKVLLETGTHFLLLGSRLLASARGTQVARQGGDGDGTGSVHTTRTGISLPDRSESTFEICTWGNLIGTAKAENVHKHALTLIKSNWDASSRRLFTNSTNPLIRGVVGSNPLLCERMCVLQDATHQNIFESREQAMLDVFRDFKSTRHWAFDAKDLIWNLN